MKKIITSNTTPKKSLLAGLYDEILAEPQKTGTSAVRAKAGGFSGATASTRESTATGPVPVQSFLSDALSKALAGAGATKTGTSAVQAKAGGFSGATAAGQKTAAATTEQMQNRLKDAVDAAIARVNAAKADDDSYEDEQAVQPTDEQRRQAALVSKLPDDFPIDEWESLPARAQLKQIQHTRLSKTEQWDLLNAKTPMSTLRDIGEQNGSPFLARLQAAVDRIVNGEETDSSKSTPLQQRAVDGQLEKEEEAKLSVEGSNWGQQVDWDTSRLAVLRNKILTAGSEDEAPAGKEPSILVGFDLFNKIEDAKRALEKKKNAKANQEIVEMFNLGYEEPYTLKENEYYYVEEAVVFGFGPTYSVIGKTILFDENKYAEYNYVGLSYSISLINIPYNHVWSRGVVSNVHNVDDYNGAFVNSGNVVGPAGYSISIGENDSDQLVVASSDVMEEFFPTGSMSGSFQWYENKADRWIYDTAPIEWASNLWDIVLPSGMIKA